MSAHCSTCTCQSDPIPQPSTSSEWARRQAREAAAEAVRVAKERRLAANRDSLTNRDAL